MNEQLELWPLKACELGGTIPAGAKIVGIDSSNFSIAILYREEGKVNDKK